MRKSLIMLFCCLPPMAQSQVLDFVSLNTRQIERLDRSKTVVIIAGGILEEHGPYLPSGTDGIFNQALAADLAKFVASKPGWTALNFPLVPLGSGAANEIGGTYSFPGSCTILPSTLRSIFMDLADQLGKERFRWIVVVHGHGDPVHNQMLDQAADYFHDTYGGDMVNVFGYIWAAKKDFRTPEQQRRDGQDEHATMTETSVILALKPEWVAPDYKAAKPYAGANIAELGQIAKAQDWRGYFGDPSLSTPSLGKQIYEQWLSQGEELISQVLAGSNYRKLPRYGDLYADDPADAAVKSVNAQLSSQHEAWLKQHAVINESEGTTTSEKLRMPGPDVQNRMLGSWSTQVTYEPSPDMPKGGTGEGTEIWRPGPGGLSVIEEYREKNEKGTVEGLGVAWWDAKAHGQRFVWCDNSNPDGCYVSKEVAKWEGASLAWKEEQENAGKKRVYSEVFRDITRTSFTQVLAEAEPGGALETTVTIRATKLSDKPIVGTETSSDDAHPLIGTWRVVEFADLDKDGKWVYLFGEHPRGYFVYDATGHVHIQIMKVPPLTPFPEANSDDGKPPTPEHALAAYNAYVAYFGTYTVDTEKHVVTHHVEGSLSPDYTDTDQPRPFKLKGDRLEIGDGKTWRRVLERVR